MQWKFTSHCLQPLLLPLQNISRTWSLLLQGSSLQVEILSIRLFVRLSVITSHCLPYSDSKFAQPPPVDLSHVTSPTVSNVPIHVSHAHQSTGPPSQSTGPPSQSTGPPMNIPIWGRVMCQLDIFCSCFWIHIQKSSSVSKNITLSFTQFFTSFIFSCRTSVRAATSTYEHTVCFLFSRILRMIWFKWILLMLDVRVPRFEMLRTPGETCAAVGGPQGVYISFTSRR